MKKTAIQILIEKFEYRLGCLLAEEYTEENQGQIRELEKCIEDATEHLPIEKEQIKEGWQDGNNSPLAASQEMASEHYYQTTYKK